MTGGTGGEDLVSNWITRYFAHSLRKPSSEERAKIARSVFRSCVACGGDLSGHSFWRLASAIIDSEDRGDELATLIKDRQWNRAVQFQDWRGDRNEREYYAIRCPNRTEISLVTIVSTADMWSDDYVESTEVLDPESSRALADLVGDRWQPF
jgi:hypothetical protein